MRIRWTPEAAANLEHISRYIAEDNLDTAFKVVNTIYERIEQLSDFPHRGRIGHEAGTRELVLSPLPYVVAYRVHEAVVEILHIWHGAQDWRR